MAQPRRQLVDATVQVCQPFAELDRDRVQSGRKPSRDVGTGGSRSCEANVEISRQRHQLVAADHVAKVLLHDAGRDLGRTRCLRSCVPDDHVERGDPPVHIAVERFERLHRRHAFHPLLETGDAGGQLALDAIEPLPGREPGDSILELAPEPCSRRLQILGEAVDARRGRMRSVGEVVVARSELRETQIGDCRELVEPATELGREAFELGPLGHAVEPTLHRPEPTPQLRNRTLHRSHALVQRQRLHQRPHLVDPRTKITRQRNDLRPPDRILQTARTSSRRAARPSTSERSATPSSRPCTDPSQPAAPQPHPPPEPHARPRTTTPPAHAPRRPAHQDHPPAQRPPAARPHPPDGPAPRRDARPDPRPRNAPQRRPADPAPTRANPAAPQPHPPPEPHARPRQRLHQRTHLVDPRTKITRQRNDLRPPDRILQTDPHRVEMRGQTLDLGTLRNAVQPTLHRPEPTPQLRNRTLHRSHTLVHGRRLHQHPDLIHPCGELLDEAVDL